MPNAQIISLRIVNLPMAKNSSEVAVEIIWTDPDTHMPQVGQKIIFKTKVLHTERTHIGSYEEDGFCSKGSTTPEAPKSVWGWHPFEDTGKRE